MKNKRRSRVGHLLNRLFNVRFWIDWERMKSFFRYLSQAIKNLFVPQASQATESFAAAKARLNLTDADLLSRQQGLLRLSIIMSVFAVLFFAYGIYNVITGGILGSILSIVVMLIAWVLAFRYHFWYFQIKTRQLGCSVREWFQWVRNGIRGGAR